MYLYFDENGKIYNKDWNFSTFESSLKTLVDKNQIAGFKTVKWDATNSQGKRVAAGMYIYQIRAGTFNNAKKMVLLK